MQHADVLEVSEDDVAELRRWLRSQTTRKSLAERARIVLLSREGNGALAIAEQLGVSEMTVLRWRKRYREGGVASLKDRPRPGQPRKLTAAKAAEILRLTMQRIPTEATHWSLRLMAEYAGVTRWQVEQVWKAADLKPHLLSTFKVSNDPKFAEKVVDVVGLYMQPPENAMVLSVDEKTQIQALDRTQPMLPLRKGQPSRRTHDYKRHGTASLYAAFDVATGNVIGRVTTKHRAREFVAFLRQIDAETPAHLDLHLIIDNSSTHKTPAVQSLLGAHPRFHVHFTPTSASWLNAVESWFSKLERRSVRRGIFTSVKELRDELKRFIAAHNAYSAKPFTWTKSADAILGSVDRARAVLQGKHD